LKKGEKTLLIGEKLKTPQLQQRKGGGGVGGVGSEGAEE